MIQKRLSISVMAVAALAVFAVAAAMLLAGGNPAQATTAETFTLAPDSGGGHLLPMATDPTPTPTPRFRNPEPCPGETGNTNTEAATVVDSGHIALFDVWWNTEELELTNSSCPPTVTHVPADPGDEEEERPATPARDDRAASSIDIAKTVIHIPNSAKITLTEAEYPKLEYPKLWEAEDAENPNGDGDRMVWKLPACPPDGAPATGGLCLSFSAALLNSEDWNGDIVYHMDHVHQVDIDRQDQRYVLAYDVANDGRELEWSSYDARVATMPVAAGGYKRPEWFFTSRGSYEFQVHITGDTNLNLGNSVNENPSVNSDVRTYILHVGAEADVGVGVTVTPESASPTNDVTITLTASNAGPDTAPGTKVEVTLPDGLTYKPTTGATGITHDSGTVTWTVGNLAVTRAGVVPPTQTITSTVDAGTRGETLKVKATISATETLQIKELARDANGEPLKDPQTQQYQVVAQTYFVPVPDKGSGNNMGMDTVTVVSIPNVNPVFGIERSVAENTAAGTSVGPRIVLKDPDEGDPQVPTLAGDGAGKFTVSLVDGGAQIAVASGAGLDHECRGRYSLTLQVSDGKDEAGNSDTVIDDTIPLDVLITNDVSDDPALTLTLDSITQGTAHLSVTHTPSHLGRPDCSDRFSFWEYEFLQYVNGEWRKEYDEDNLDLEFEYGGSSGDSRKFRVDLVGKRSNFTEFHRTSSPAITVNWP